MTLIVRSNGIILVMHLFLVVLLDVSADSDITERWNESSNGQVLWRDGCFFGGTNQSVTELKGNITVEECGDACLTQPKCNYFNYHPYRALRPINYCTLNNWKAELMPEPLPSIEKEGPRCGFVPSRIWQTSIDNDRILVRSNCSFPYSSTNERARHNHFTHYENRMYHSKHASPSTHRVSIHNQCTNRKYNRYRSVDGRCNNLADPSAGSATTVYQRMAPANYADGSLSLTHKKKYYFLIYSLLYSVMQVRAPFAVR